MLGQVDERELQVRIRLHLINPLAPSGYYMYHQP
jgi:hypothetical protein